MEIPLQELGSDKSCTASGRTSVLNTPVRNSTMQINEISREVRNDFASDVFILESGRFERKNGRGGPRSRLEPDSQYIFIQFEF